MRILVNEKLSEHRFKTPEGYLVCTDAILARTGKQTYRRGEVFGQDCKDADAEVEVDRNEKEVFSDATLASFENKPLTVEHPDENVNVDNHSRYAVGFVRDVKRAVVDGQDVMTGTLVITDAQTIREIEDGEHTDLSCGYDCDIEDEANPQQRNIRGNHVALCQQGRAGIARIIDSVEDSNTFVVIGNKGTRPYWSVIVANSEQEAKDKYLKMKPEFIEGIKIRKADYVDIQHSKETGRYFDEIKDDINWLNVKRKNAADKWLKQKGLMEEFLDKDLYKKYTDYEYAVMKGMPKIDKFSFESEKDLSLYNNDSCDEEKSLSQDLTDTINKLKGMQETKDANFWYSSYPFEVWLSYKSGRRFMAAAYKTHKDARIHTDELRNKWKENGEIPNAEIREVKDSIDDGFGILSTGQEAKLRKYCDRYDVDFDRAYKEIERQKKVYPGKTVDKLIEGLLDDLITRRFDSINDVDPREGESKDDFISRFMSETKEEYPDQKQRYAVALSYWDKNKVMKTKGNDEWKLPYTIWVKDKGRWVAYRASNSATVNKLDFIKLGYEDVTVLKNDGSSPKDSINDSYQWYRVTIPGSKDVHLVRAKSIEDAVSKLNRR